MMDARPCDCRTGETRREVVLIDVLFILNSDYVGCQHHDELTLHCLYRTADDDTVVPSRTKETSI